MNVNITITRQQVIRWTLVALVCSVAVVVAITAIGYVRVKMLPKTECKAAVSQFDSLDKFVGRARLAYAENPNDYTKFVAPNKTYYKDMPHVNVRTYVDYDDKNKVQWISVRGTNNQANVAVDVSYMEESSTRLGIPIHAGFHRSAEFVALWLEDNLHKDYTTYVTGHSLGGAVAVIISLYLKQDGYHVERVVTFGQPKVTTEKGVAKYDGELNLIRVVNAGDPVPQVPPMSVLTFLSNGVYRHFGKQIYLEDNDCLVYDKNTSEDFFLTSLWAHVFSDDVARHDSSLYAKLVDKYKAAK